MTVTPRYVTSTDGVSLAVFESGDPGSPTVVLLHGYPDNHTVWGWAAVHAPALQGRITSFTSISAPSLDYAGTWLRDLRHDPGAKLRQLAHSYYMGLFQLPRVPELAARSGLLDRLISLGARGPRSSRRSSHEPQRGLPDKINGLELYRANLSRRPAPVRTTIPVQIIVPRKDPYVGRAFAVDSARPWVDDLTVTDVAGGHWVVSERPDVIARLAAEFIDGVGTATTAARPVTRGDYAGKFVVVTGGARGIGRATALEFARQGADVLIADVDDVAAEQTVGDVRELGVQAWSAHLDVGDVDAWEAFAEDVRAEHGVPDVMVNNAGIGIGGPFLGTPAAEWGRVVNTNLWSVIHGSRLFAAQMVDRGQGGRIVNVASAAAYSPSIAYPAYATTKAAVLMLTECLQAELVGEGISVTAVCPGVIDTDISRTTVHVGVDEVTAARLREHQIASYRRRNYPPEKVAHQLVRAATAGRPIVHVTPEAKALRALSRVSTRLTRRLARVDLNAL